MPDDDLLHGAPETVPGIGKLRNALMQKIVELSGSLGGVAHSVSDPPAAQREAIEQTKARLKTLEAKADAVGDRLGSAVLGPACEGELLNRLGGEGAQTERDLAKHLDTDAWDVAALADTLATSGLVEITSGSPEDSPIRRWQITDNGRDVIGKPAGR